MATVMHDVSVSEYACMVTQSPQAHILKFAQPCDGGYATAVELGAGAGRNLLFLSQLGYNVIGVESSVGHGKIHFPHDLILDPERRVFFEERGVQVIDAGYGLPELPTASVSLLVAMNVFQFFPANLLNTMCRTIEHWLTPNARLIASVVTKRTCRSGEHNRYALDELVVRQLFPGLTVVYLAHMTAQVPDSASWSNTRQLEVIEFVCDKSN